MSQVLLICALLTLALVLAPMLGGRLYRYRDKPSSEYASEDFTTDAKKRQRAEAASEFFGKLENSATRCHAHEAAEHVLAKYEHQITGKLQAASDAQQVGIHAVGDFFLAPNLPFAACRY